MSIRSRCTLMSTIVLTVLSFSNPAAAQSESISQAKIGDVAWISGNWVGSALGGKFEETWNPPSAGSMVGLFKLTKNDQVVFYEILTIVEKGNSLLLRLKHFNPDLTGWEEKNKSVEFPLVAISKNEVKFDGLTFRRVSENEIHIVVITKENNREQKLKFVCKRAKG